MRLASYSSSPNVQVVLNLLPSAAPQNTNTSRSAADIQNFVNAVAGALDQGIPLAVLMPAINEFGAAYALTVQSQWNQTIQSAFNTFNIAVGSYQQNAAIAANAPQQTQAQAQQSLQVAQIYSQVAGTVPTAAQAAAGTAALAAGVPAQVVAAAVQNNAPVPQTVAAAQAQYPAVVAAATQAVAPVQTVATVAAPLSTPMIAPSTQIVSTVTENPNYVSGESTPETVTVASPGISPLQIGAGAAILYLLFGR